MAWKRYFTPASGESSSPLTRSSSTNPTRTNYSSYLPDVYSGHPNRLERYAQYDTMDLDPEVNAAFDILSEFCTQLNDENGTPFQVFFKEQATPTEVKIIKKYMQQWVKVNKFGTRMFKLVRNTFKYGDCFFIRDPETLAWFYIDPSKVDKIIVNESEGKKPEQYVIRDMNVNFQNLTVTQINPSNQNATPGGTTYVTGGVHQRGMVGAYPQSSGSRFTINQNQWAIDAKHVVHLSLSEGLDNNFPFGNSLMETIFKVYKQKELLEDAIIIYRVQRAPERRVFYIDVGNMPSHLAMGFVERVKNEVNQRRIPSATGGGQSVIDSGYNPLCLDLETKIPLLDGRTLTLAELITEFEQGKENWAYSCNPETGEIVPGVINWAGLTRKNTEVIKITFDNGKELICTPDHKIPVFGKGFVEAKDLTDSDSLISFSKQQVPIKKNGNSYEKVWDHASKSWIWTHRIVAEFFRNKKKHQEFTYLEEYKTSAKNVIHHADKNRYNNDPRNLFYMTKQDHILYHAAHKKEFWENMSDDYRINITSKISNTLKQRWKNMSDDERLSALWNIRAAQKKSVWLRQNDPDVAQRYKINASMSRKNFINNNLNFKETLLQNLRNRVKIKNQPLNLTFEMLQIIAEKVKQGNTNKNKVLSLCDADKKLLALVKENNSTSLNYKNAQCKINFTKFGYSKLDRLLDKFGYKNWKTFVKEIDNFNHKIVKIEKVSNRDVGTITIDGTEKWHNFHTFAIDSGIFIKNSINEDYFFPQTAEGRGSKVEILQGGQNLGEIDDLLFFTQKLMRALRIPSSYLPTGVDDSQTIFSDGKVGTAYIQELRFNNYCQRLQSLITETFDSEFKLYLYNKGMNIDPNLFDIKLNPPQNFAAYRQAEMDTARVSTYGSVASIPHLSKRFALKRFLGLTAEEIAENEQLWREENLGSAQPATDTQSEMRSMGITSSGIGSDMNMLGQSDVGSPELQGADPGAEPSELGGAAPSAAPPTPGGAPTL
jgi:intein/homing endonuclease